MKRIFLANVLQLHSWSAFPPQSLSSVAFLVDDWGYGCGFALCTISLRRDLDSCFLFDLDLCQIRCAILVVQATVIPNMILVVWKVI